MTPIVWIIIFSLLGSVVSAGGAALLLYFSEKLRDYLPLILSAMLQEYYLEQLPLNDTECS